MGARLSLDTTFLIDQQREAARRAPGKAQVFLAQHADDIFCISLTAWGEYLAGFSHPDDDFVQGIRARLEILVHDEEVARSYSRLFRSLKEKGKLIGSNDLWIAATAVRWKVPLVTANVDEFRRVPGLKVVRY